MKMVHSFVTRKYQITLPKEIREKLKIHIGDKVQIINQGDEIVIHKEDSADMNDIFNSWDLKLSGTDFENKIRKLSDIREKYANHN